MTMQSAALELMIRLDFTRIKVYEPLVKQSPELLRLKLKTALNTMQNLVS